jgi:hypothetical protein
LHGTTRRLDPCQLETRDAESVPTLKLTPIENNPSETVFSAVSARVPHRRRFFSNSRQLIDTETLNLWRRVHKRHSQYA